MGFKNWFKKNDTVVDLTDLQRRGIIKKKTEAVEISGNNFDNSSGDGSSALGFLGSLAGSGGGATETSTDETSMVFSPTGKQRLRGILRDMKSDMKNTTDKIYKITDRLDLIEKKLERLERRAGYP